MSKTSVTRAASAGVLAILGLSAFVGSATAGSTFSYDGYSVVNEVNVHIGGSGPSNFQNGYFGSGQIVLDGISGLDIAAWCIDATHDLQSSDTYTIVSPNPSLTNNGGNGGLGNSLSSIVLGEIGALVRWGDANLKVDPNYSAAVQLAIWTIEYPNGTFVSDSNAVNNDVLWLVSGAETGKGAFTADPDILEVIDPVDNQGLIFAPTPLPSSWTLLLAGFAALAFFGYRRRERTQLV